MTTYSPGDNLGDCPGCHATQGVVFRGEGEAVCTKCGAVYNVTLDEGEQEAAAPPPPARPSPIRPLLRTQDWSFHDTAAPPHR